MKWKQHRAPGAAGMVAALVLLTVNGKVQAWNSAEHINLTKASCNNQRVGIPANTVIAAYKDNADDARAKAFSPRFCEWLAGYAAYPDASDFANDQAHSQTSYKGGIGGYANTTDIPVRQVVENVNNVEVDSSISAILKEIQYFKPIADGVTNDLETYTNDLAIPKQNNATYKVPIGFGRSKKLTFGKYITILKKDGSDGWAERIGKLLHAMQDSYSHQFITGAQHSYDGFIAKTNPDGTLTDGRLAGAQAATNKFFDTLAKHIKDYVTAKIADPMDTKFKGDWGGPLVIDIIAVHTPLMPNWVDASTEAVQAFFYNKGGRATTGLAGLVEYGSADPLWKYWWQGCDQPGDHRKQGKMWDYALNNRYLNKLWTIVAGEWTELRAKPAYAADMSNLCTDTKAEENVPPGTQCGWRRADFTAGGGYISSRPDINSVAPIRVKTGVVRKKDLMSFVKGTTQPFGCPAVTNRSDCTLKGDGNYALLSPNWVTRLPSNDAPGNMSGTDAERRLLCPKKPNK